MRDLAIDVAMRSAQVLIVKELDEQKAHKMLDESIRDLGRKLH